MTTAMQRRPREEQPVARLRNEIETVFDRFLSRWQAPFNPGDGLDRLWGWDVEDRDNEIVVRAEIPGFEPEEIDVQISGGALTIKAEQKQEGGESRNGGGQTRAYRSFYLPQWRTGDPPPQERRNEAQTHSGSNLIF